MSSATRKNDEREESAEQYYTPDPLALACMDRLVADGFVRVTPQCRAIDPCAGAGAWIRAMVGVGIDPQNVVANDIDADLVLACELLPASNRWEGDAKMLAALGRAGEFDLVGGNPPYNDADEHVLRALQLRSAQGTLAYILRSGWFAALKRLPLWQEYRPAKLYLLTPRPSFLVGSGTDSATYFLAAWSRPWEDAHRMFPAKIETTIDVLDWSEYQQRWAEQRKQARKQARAASSGAEGEQQHATKKRRSKAAVPA